MPGAIGETRDVAKGRWGALALLALAELLAMSLWFAASAVAPQLKAELNLSSGQEAWLTMSVQLGFVLGALGSAIVNLPDRAPAQRVFWVSALVGAGLNALLTVGEPTFVQMVVLRVLVGVTLAGVYPTGMKLMASWFVRGRGLAIGAVVGALAAGSALPHLVNALGVFGGGEGVNGLPPWRDALLVSSALAVVSACIAALFVAPGPHLPKSAPFDARQAARIFTAPAVRRANFGYLGHMWELYAAWTWAPVLLLESYRRAGLDDRAARFAGFAMVAVGGVSCVLAGWTADRVGRTTVVMWSLALSGACALVVGFLGAHPVLLTAVCLVWGFAIIADSAQFSAAVSELSDPRYVGTSLTMQTCLGFLLTMGSIRLAGHVAQGGEGGDAWGAWGSWGWAMALLALGPAFGLYHIWRLRRMPEATKMASGRR